MIMKRNSIIKQLICLICFLCLSQVLWAERLTVYVKDNQGMIYDAKIDVVGPGNSASTLNLGPRIYPALRGGASYDIHVWDRGKHIKVTIMMPIGSDLIVEINVDNYPFTGLLSVPEFVAYSPIQNKNRDILRLFGFLPDKQRLIS